MQNNFLCSKPKRIWALAFVLPWDLCCIISSKSKLVGNVSLTSSMGFNLSCNLSYIYCIVLLHTDCCCLYFFFITYFFAVALIQLFISAVFYVKPGNQPINLAPVQLLLIFQPEKWISLILSVEMFFHLNLTWAHN